MSCQYEGRAGSRSAAQDWAAPKWLTHPNIELFIARRQGDFAKLRKLHHKMMVIDKLIVVAGSFNYTEPANEFNNENIFRGMGSKHAEVEGVDVESDPLRRNSRGLKQEIDKVEIFLSCPYDSSAQAKERADEDTTEELGFQGPRSLFMPGARSYTKARLRSELWRSLRGLGLLLATPDEPNQCRREFGLDLELTPKEIAKRPIVLDGLAAVAFGEICPSKGEVGIYKSVAQKRPPARPTSTARAKSRSATRGAPRPSSACSGS